MFFCGGRRGFCMLENSVKDGRWHGLTGKETCVIPEELNKLMMISVFWRER